MNSESPTFKNLLPILYSFRRCPYAMRARLAIAYSGISVALREILLKDKPEEMITISAKGTVPVLQLPDSTVIDESLDIMHWSIAQNDPDAWYPEDREIRKNIDALIQENDIFFKPRLDKYKYAVRFPEYSEKHYRLEAEEFIVKLEKLLSNNNNLLCSSITMADIAIFPFIRQFANVDNLWFKESAYYNTRRWLNEKVNSQLFLGIMRKYPQWSPQQEECIVFP